MPHQHIPWHQGAVIYQIYPRSFLDTTGSGSGDLQGIIRKLDYLGGANNSLGVTAIWLSPIYTSPMADFGYDISDYNDVDPIFGDLADLRLLISEAHKRNIKIVLDFVPNHSSDEHPWFMESSSSLDNSKRDWYVWRSAKPNGDLPNNWVSNFGGPAWQFSEKTKQYYLHSYLAKQPDLNWDNPEVREAMKSAMRFWLDLGADGFRVDAVDWMSKDPELKDDPLAYPGADGTIYAGLHHINSRDGPHLFERLNEMTEVLQEYDDRFMITEAHPETDNKIKGYLQYYESVNSQLSAPFNFEGIHLPWEAAVFRSFLNDFQGAMRPGYAPIYTIGNHDESRVASRIGGPSARTAAMLLLTLPGLAFIYYGDELGMTDVLITKEQIRDPFTEPGRGRDKERTPMQWDATAQAGFTKGTPWLPVSPDYKELNVHTESQDPKSLLNLYRCLTHFRDQSDILKNGDYHSIDLDTEVLSYERSVGHEKLRVLLNFSGMTKRISMGSSMGTVQLTTSLDKENDKIDGDITMRPHEGLLIKVTHD
jgi:alpha-glucosidase